MFSQVTCDLEAGPAPASSRLILDGSWVWTLRADGTLDVEVAPLSLAYLAGRTLTPDETDADLVVAYERAMRRIAVLEGWGTAGVPRPATG